jgi:hypothetical protein
MGRATWNWHSALAGGVARERWEAVRKFPTADQAAYYRQLVTANGNRRVLIQQPGPGSGLAQLTAPTTWAHGLPLLLLARAARGPLLRVQSRSDCL